MEDNLAKIWLNIAYYEWLENCQFKHRDLRDPTKDIVKQMHDAVNQKNYAVAEQCMERLQSLNDRFSLNQTRSSKKHSYEVPETLLECGRAAYAMGEKLAAMQLFGDTAKKYIGNDHCRAVTLWMLGCVQWQFPTRIDDAIVSWESSYEIFKDLKDRSNRVEFGKWYQYWYEVMQSRLSGAIDGKHVAPPPQREWPQWLDPSITKKTTKVVGRNDDNVLRAFAVYESIPAGGFSTLPISRTWIEIDRVLIDQVPHYVLNLRGGKTVILKDTEHYIVIKVLGESMNKKNIENDDYVLMRVQEAAENEDIVAVEVDDYVLGDEKASLKQFFRSGGKVILQPQSTNPDYQAYEFDKGIGVHVRGVALAVLKRVE